MVIEPGDSLGLIAGRFALPRGRSLVLPFAPATDGTARTLTGDLAGELELTGSWERLAGRIHIDGRDLVLSPALEPYIVDATVVTGINDFEGSVVEVGGVHCMTATATTDGGPVFGKPSDLARIAFDGGSVVFDGAQGGDQLCVRGVEPGTTEMTVTWGTGSVTQTIIVQ